jgi:hypothetical protein
MRKIQNDNLTFRVTTDLKSRLTEFCLENDLHNSDVLRQALAKYLREQMEVELPRLIVKSPCGFGRSPQQAAMSRNLDLENCKNENGERRFHAESPAPDHRHSAR